MRAIWSGSITFGLVNVPVKLYSATEDHDLSLHQVHDADGGRIHYQRTCEVCGNIIDYEHIDKAYVDGDETVVLTKDDLASLPQEKSKDISVVEFVPSDHIDPILLDRSYYLEPTGKSVKAYHLLLRTLEETDRTAIVQFALRQKTRLAALRVRDNVLMVQTLRWADEVRSADFPALSADVTVTAKELQLASALVESYSSDFTPEEFHDDYQQELRTLIDAKREQGKSLDTAATFGEADTGDDAEVIDLMEALRQSVRKSREATKEAPAETTPAKKAPAKKTRAKKAPTKKTPAKTPASAAKSGDSRKKPTKKSTSRKAG